MKNRLSFMSGFVVAIVFAVAGVFLYNNRDGFFSEAADSNFAITSRAQAAAVDGLVQIQPASTVIRDLRATGNIELVAKRTVALKVNSEIIEVVVKVGDVVNEHDLLVTQDTTLLQRELERAEIDFESARLGVVQN
ncbi:hypothetical protein KFU94_32290 [Chloroflexi bacterium TSY]|nr:hypothetical protein [Chloroflexi bacterium TSY]